MQTRERACFGPQHQRGIVLPMALIMLVIISIAGLLAARNSATHEQFSNNMRTTQVARQAAELGLRYCEMVAIDLVDNEGAVYAADAAKIVMVKLATPEDNAAVWNTKANWETDPVAPNLISAPLNYSAGVQGDAELKNAPTCIIQAVEGDPATGDRFLITARGLSNDAALTDNELTQGSEIWLQSILSPGVPIKSAAGGNE
jgi:type IV pilus assembly protein PilX